MNQLENLENWLGASVHTEDDGNNVVDLVFEFLHDQQMLTAEGEVLAKEYWEKYVRREKHEEV